MNMPREVQEAIGLEGSPEPFDGMQVSAFIARSKGAMLFEDSLGVCRFNTRTDIVHLAQALNAVTGWDVDPDEAMDIGRRAANLMRAFNLRHGIDPGLDAPSRRYGSTPLDGPAAGVSVQPVWDDMLANYYQLLGWDAQGVPIRETLESLGIGAVADDLGV